MKEYYIHQKTLHASNRMLVQDADGKALYFLVGRLQQKGDSLAIYSMSGERLAEIKHVSEFLGVHYQLKVGKEIVGNLTKKISFFFHESYSVKELNWVVHGDVKSRNYKIIEGFLDVFKMYPADSSMGDVLCMEIKDQKNAPLLICIAYVLDNWGFSQDKEESKRRSGRMERAYYYKVDPE